MILSVLEILFHLQKRQFKWTEMGQPKQNKISENDTLLFLSKHMQNAKTKISNLKRGCNREIYEGSSIQYRCYHGE